MSTKHPRSPPVPKKENVTMLLVLGRNAAAASGEDNEKSTLTDFQKWRGCEKKVFMYECFYTAMHARLEVKN